MKKTIMSHLRETQTAVQNQKRPPNEDKPPTGGCLLSALWLAEYLKTKWAAQPMMRLARKHSETGSRTVAGTMLILNFVHLRRFKDRIQNKIHEIYTHSCSNYTMTERLTVRSEGQMKNCRVTWSCETGTERWSKTRNSAVQPVSPWRISILWIRQEVPLFLLLSNTNSESRELTLTLTHRPVSDGFRHEVVLSNVLSEGNQPARLIQHVFPHQTRHPRHTLYPRHVCGDVGPRVGGAEIHLWAGKRPAQLKSHTSTCSTCGVLLAC